jgi:hypothetical protein
MALADTVMVNSAVKARINFFIIVMFFKLYILVYDAKKQQKNDPPKGFSLKWEGKIPIVLVLLILSHETATQ